MNEEENTGFRNSDDPDDRCGFLVADGELEAMEREVRTFIDDAVTAAGADGVVVAMSGGIDSSLTASLAAEALGSDRVLGLGLPCSKTDTSHMADARGVAEELAIEFREVQLRPVLDVFEDVAAPAIAPADGADAIANVIARLRMICAYYAANARNLLVCGTANRSELLLGYFTKYGDGAADCYPLGDCYKTEVRALAEHVGLPRRIVEKDPTAGLRAGQTDAADLGATYDVIDPLLRRIVDYGTGVEDAASDLSVDPETAWDLAAAYAATRHKRAMPPTPGLRPRSGGRSTGARNPTWTPAPVEREADVLDDLYGVLADGRCRAVLRYFLDRPHDVATLDELLAYVEGGSPHEPDADLGSGRATLYHAVLPRLAAACLLDFDHRTETVFYRGHPLVERHLDRRGGARE